MKYVKNTLSIIGLIALVGILIQSFTKPTVASVKPQKTTDSTQTTSRVGNYNIYPVQLPESMNFAGEPVPLKNPDIYKRLDREMLINTYWQSNTFSIIKRAHQFFPIIEPILEANNIPDDFKYLAIAESGLLQVVSPAGATGFWQFMPATARQYGLEVNDNIDERYNIRKATKAACAYLKNAKQRLGSWTLAAAAYNAGIRGITREQEQQEVTNYYDLLLNPQTSRYMFRILAYKALLSHPHKYGYNFEEEDLYNAVPTYVVKVDSSVQNFAKFAKHFGINYKILKIHNPWLREPQLENEEHVMYKIRIPKDGYYTYTP